ncbi:MAG: hypothetical protein LBG58_14350 [Planctomycetaceae bacterium]|jgi:hypothetical protein|nr:hypothetical protein [Planctomycetaceae bacterium]
MSVTENFNYDQIRDNVLQLSPAERSRLVRELKQHEEREETKISEPDNSGFTELWRENGMVCYRVNGDPIFTPEEFEEFRRNRERIEAEWEKMTPEEIKQRKEQQEELMRRADEAYAKIPEESIQESLEIWRSMGLCRKDPSL